MVKRVADVIVETLQAAGVKHCWGELLKTGIDIAQATVSIESREQSRDEFHHRVLSHQAE